MMHQLTVTPDASFVTLTYDDAHLMRAPSLITHAGTLMKHHLQIFFKRMRRRMGKESVKGPLKYYACGEYGDETQRPHYHAILFNVPFAWVRAVINDLWTHGTRNDVSLVNESRIRYVAGYIDKKLFGEKGERAYRDVEPPFQLSSNGIGVEFALQNFEQILYDAILPFKKTKLPVPRLYLEKISNVFPEAVDGLRDRLYESARLTGIDFLLENFPEFGGRAFDQLNTRERREFADWLGRRNAAYFTDLVAGIRHRELSKGERI